MLSICFRMVDVLERGLTEQDFALLDVGLGKLDALRRNLHIAFFQPREAQQHTGFQNRQEVLDVHHQFFRETEEIFTTAAIAQ